MGELLKNLPAWAGTLPGWITSAGVVGLLGLLLRYQLGRQKLQIDAAQVDINAQQIANTDEADIRDHYAEEVKELRAALKEQSARHQQRENEMDDRYRRLLQESEARHEECQTQRRELRHDMDRLLDEMAGLRRTIVQYSAEGVVRLGEISGARASEEVERAAHSTLEQIDRVAGQVERDAEQE